MPQEAHHDIELATALHEANMARLQHTMQTFLDGPDASNRHVARAVETIFDDLELMLGQSLNRLIEAVDAVYDDPADREVPEANGRWADQISQLTERFVNHMNAHFTRGKPYTAQSVFYAMTLTMQATNHALQTLHGEIIARSRGDTVAEAYRQALLEAAEFPPHAAEVIEKMHQDDEATDDRMRRHLQSAREAVRDSERIVEYHRRIVSEGEKGRSQ